MNEVQPVLKAVKLDGMEMTVTGFRPGGRVTKGGIRAHLMSLNYHQAGMNWCVGDLLVMGEDHFGEDWIVQAVSDHMHSMSPEMLLQCRRIAERFPHESRITELFWTHHQAVAGIKDEDERTKLLESCLVPSEDAPGRGPDKPMTVTDLRRAVRALRIDSNGQEDDPGVKLLESAKRAIEALPEQELSQLAEWMAVKGYARKDSEQYPCRLCGRLKEWDRDGGHWSWACDCHRKGEGDERDN